MRNRFALYLIAAWLLLLAGCAGVKAPPAATPAPPGAEAPAGEGAAPVPPQAAPAEPVQSSAMSGNRAVVALLDRAQRDNAAGQREAAGASLERALRIEPRNPWLWLELAQLRLEQGQYAQAITLARKSNSFAGKQRRVQAENWQVIGQSRAAQGDSAGAEKAFKLSAELLQQDKDERGSGFFR